MAKRFVYFDYKNTMYCKTVDVTWDRDCMAVNRALCNKEIYESIPTQFKPAMVIDSYSYSNIAKTLIPNKLTFEGRVIKDVWNEFARCTDVSVLPPGVPEYFYMNALSAKQICFALSIKSCYDLYFNEETQIGSSSRALIACKMLVNQNKLDYLYDVDKFLYWYFVNCARPIEWDDTYWKGV